MAVSVNNIIQNSAGEYLMQMRDGNEGICNPLMWNFFGGSLETPDEDPLVAASREFEEELGKKPSVVFSLLGTVAEGEKMVYVCAYPEKLEWSDITIQEGAGAGYFTKEEMLKIPLTEKTKLIIEKFL